MKRIIFFTILFIAVYTVTAQSVTKIESNGFNIVLTQWSGGENPPACQRCTECNRRLHGWKIVEFTNCTGASRGSVPIKSSRGKKVTDRGTLSFLNLLSHIYHVEQVL